jgi:hypothetical protein
MTEPQPPPADQPKKPRQRLPLVTALLYLFLLATVCFVGYQVRLCVIGTSTAARMPQAPVVDTGALKNPKPLYTPPQSQPGNMGGLVETQPAIEANITTIGSDPGGFAPPAGAKAIVGYEQQSPGQVQQQMEYQYPGELEAAKEHYVNLFKKEGFAVIPERPDPKAPPRDPQDSVNLNFTKDLLHVSLALRKLPGQVKMVRILIVTTNVVSQ